MPDYAQLLSLAGYALGAFGGVLLFIEFFQTPSYVSYDAEWDEWNVNVTPPEMRQHTWAGRVGALLIAVAFTLQFVAGLL